jgi:hypothetical protein
MIMLKPNKLYRISRTRSIAAILLLALVFLALMAWKWDAVTNLAKNMLSIDPSRIQSKSIALAPKNNKGITALSSSDATSGASTSANSSVIVKAEKTHVPEVCGMSTSEAEAFLATDGKANAEIANRIIADALSKFVQSKNLQEKATGLLIATMQANLAAMELERLNTPGCKAGEPCFFKQFEAQLLATTVNSEPLVKLALDSNDASVYAAALYACGPAKGGACASLSYARLAEIEPDNAAAWLMVASEAETKKDSVARALALKRAASAKGYDRHVPSLAPIFLLDSVQTKSALAQSTVAAKLNDFGINIGGAQLTQGVLNHCNRPDPMDAATSATCEALATKLIEKDKTLIGAQIPLMIGTKIGWNAERLKPLNDEMEAATGKILQDINDTDKFTCDRLAKTTQMLQRSLTLGQRASYVN